MTLAFNRRQALIISVSALTTATLGASVGPAHAANDAQELIKKFTGGKEPAQGKVRLDVPEIAENGNTVPMTVSVDSPMTEESYVKEVLVVADGNPRGGVVTFHFTPASGVAEATPVKVMPILPGFSQWKLGGFYTTLPLEEDVEVIRSIEAKLDASTSAKDTDWMMRLIDVHPDGHAALL